MADLPPEDRAFLAGLLRDPPARAEVLAQKIGRDFPNMALIQAMQQARRDPDCEAALRIVARRLRDAGKPLPVPLLRYGFREWANPPAARRGRRRNSERDMWAAAVYDCLRRKGWKAKDARAFIAEGLSVSVEAVRSILRGAPSRPRLRLG